MSDRKSQSSSPKRPSAQQIRFGGKGMAGMAPIPTHRSRRTDLNSSSLSLRAPPRPFRAPPAEAFGAQPSASIQFPTRRSPGTAQRTLPSGTPPSQSRLSSVRRNLFGTQPSSSSGAAQRSGVSLLGSPGGRSALSQPMSQISSPKRTSPESRPLGSMTPPNNQQSTTQSYLDMARNWIGLGGLLSSPSSQGPPRTPRIRMTPKSSTLRRSPGIAQPSVTPKTTMPPPRRSGSPTPEIVKKFRNPITGSPDFEQMRIQMRPPAAGPSRMVGQDLARRSQQQVGDIYSRFKRKEKKEGLLRSKSLTKSNIDNRWRGHSTGSTDEWFANRRPLLPRSSSERDLYDDRFQQPLHSMGSRPLSRIMPTGRLGFGPMQQRQRSQSMSDLDRLRVPGINEDPSMWSNREQGFAQRLRALDKEDLQRYRYVRWQSDADRYPRVADRMVGAPTGTNLLDQNRSRTSQYLRDHKLYTPDRRDRKKNVYDSSILPTTIFDKEYRYPSIPEKGQITQILDRTPSIFKPLAPWEKRQKPKQQQQVDQPLLAALAQPSAPTNRRQRRWSLDLGELPRNAPNPTMSSGPTSFQRHGSIRASTGQSQSLGTRSRTSSQSDSSSQSEKGWCRQM